MKRCIPTCATVLFVVLLSSAHHLDAQTSLIVGSWHGTSTCVDKVHFPACHDEEVIYDVRVRPGTADTVDLRADKVVNGVREFMGELVFVRHADGSWSAALQGSRVPGRVELAINGIAMTGRLLELPSERVIRRMSLRRVTVAK